MYTSALLASLALMASSVLAGSPGQAIVVNKCTYPVYLFAVPSADGGYSEVDKTLQPGDSFSQTWTQLTNGNGWSIKLSKTAALTQNILQYEYTWQNNGKIWYDLSCVNGNPWANDWQVSATGPNCNPRQTYYRYDTDDAFGMQDCVDSSSVTVTLCTGSSSSGNIVSSAVSIVADVVAPSSNSPVAAAAVVPSTPAVVIPTTPAAVATTSSTQAAIATTSSTQAPAAAPLAAGEPLGFANNHFYNADAVVAEAVASPTTLATVVKPSTTAATLTTMAAVVNDDMDVVTEVVTIVETAYAYETPMPEKRHVHHPNHPHFR